MSDSTPMLNGEIIVAATFFSEHGRIIPHCILTKNARGFYNTYDVDYCRRDDCALYHCSGGGGGGSEEGLYIEGLHRCDGVQPIIYALDHIKLFCNGQSDDGAYMKEPVTRSTDTWPNFDLADMIETESVYCKLCKDFLPEDFYVCEHIKECEECGHFKGDGVDDDWQPCECLTLVDKEVRAL